MKLPAMIFCLLFPTLLFAAGIKEITVPSADDGDVVVQFNDETKLPIGASDDRAQVTGANFLLEATPREETKIHWCWSYIVDFKGGVTPSSIKVIDETTKPSVMKLDVLSPQLRGTKWLGIEPYQPMSKQLYDSMLAKPAWFRLFKIVITYPDGKLSIFHQAVVYQQATRVHMLETVASMLKMPNPSSSSASTTEQQ